MCPFAQVAMILAKQSADYADCTDYKETAGPVD
jgi:hypothetical protein